MHSKSIRVRLLTIFILLAAVFSLVFIGMFALHSYVVRQYQSLSNNMIAEYRLTDAVSQLIAAYNNRFLSTGNDDARTDKQIDDIKATIKSNEAYLDGSIEDGQSTTDYTGLKFTIADTTAEIDSGLETLDKGDVSNASSHYNAANKKYAFVQTDSTNLLFDELKYASSVQTRINRTDSETRLAAGIVIVLVMISSLLYSVRFARRLVDPLVRLSGVAQDITNGNMQSTISDDLLRKPDEVGILARSFHTMVAKLKENIQALHDEKASVELKVTERTEELSDEKVRLAASVDSLTFGFIMTDADHNLFMINNAAREILSLPDGDEPAETLPADKWTIDHIGEIFGEEFDFISYIHDVAGVGKNANRRDIDFRGHILRIFLTPIIDSDDQQLGKVVLIQDITEEKVMERSKDEFFSIASHELRTPLTAIRGNASMLSQIYADQIKDPDFGQMLGDIHSSSVRLIAIVNDFLDVSRLEQGKFKLTTVPFHIEEVLESVVYEMHAVSKEKKNTLKTENTLDKTPMVFADKDRVKQVVYNLLGNAMRFTENGTITIKTEVVDDQLKIHVIDTGAGISEQNQKLLFHKFQQASDSLLTRETSKGTGLGLYISKMLIELMKGKITLESTKEGKGSEFSFTLPLATADEIAATAIVPADAATAPAK